MSDDRDPAHYEVLSVNYYKVAGSEPRVILELTHYPEYADPHRLIPGDKVQIWRIE